MKYDIRNLCLILKQMNVHWILMGMNLSLYKKIEIINIIKDNNCVYYKQHCWMSSYAKMMC